MEPTKIKIIYKPQKETSMELHGEVFKAVEIFEEAVKEYNEFSLTVEI